MADLIGQKIGNYVLREYLGGGGAGQVYRGEHIYLKTQAAIKILHRVTSQGMDKFKTEAQTIAVLNEDPHILSVFDFGVDGGRPFLVMKYAPQGTLRDRHPHRSVLPLPLIVSYVRPIASALQYAHDHNVIHRDIKPENVLVDNQQSLLLSDFGIAAIAHSTNSMYTMDKSGTAHYMAPEQSEGHPRPASDQYALAIMVYEWLTGQRPFSGDTIVALCMQHAMTPVPSLRKNNHNIPLEVEQVILTALEKQPQDRFASVSAFATAFEQASAEQLSAHELQQTLLQAILSIPNPMYRRVLLYLYIAGLDEQGVAQRLQVPRQHVKPLREKALIVLNTKPEVIRALRSLSQ